MLEIWKASYSTYQPLLNYWNLLNQSVQAYCQLNLILPSLEDKLKSFLVNFVKVKWILNYKTIYLDSHLYFLFYFNSFLGW